VVNRNLRPTTTHLPTSTSFLLAHMQFSKIEGTDDRSLKTRQQAHVDLRNCNLT
jgi:hypothetical protein